MTNDEALAKAYPEYIEQIRANSRGDFLQKEANTRVAANILSYAFLWHDAPEGWQFWHDIYEKSPALT